MLTANVHMARTSLQWLIGTCTFGVMLHLTQQNMIQILKRWQELSPPDKDLITQQGGYVVHFIYVYIIIITLKLLIIHYAATFNHFQSRYNLLKLLIIHYAATFNHFQSRYNQTLHFC
jgi:hypothetical protein